MLVVDFQRGFVETSDPLMAAALAQTARILAAARSRRIPVFLIRLVFEDVSDIVPSLAARFDLRQFLRGSASAEISPKQSWRDGGSTFVSQPS
jgi:nicotinamidase-related amidase